MSLKPIIGGLVDFPSTVGGGGAGAWGSITGTLSDQSDLANVLDGKQPLDSDLTAIAALFTDAFGRNLLIKTDGASVRTYIGAGTSSFDGVFSSLTSRPTTLSGYGITDAQGLDTELTALAGVTSAADKVPYFTGSGTASVTDLTSTARSLLDDTSVSVMRTTLGLGTLATQSGTFSGTSSGTNTGDQDLSGLQPLDADLTAIAGLATDTFGRALLTKTDASSVRTYIGAGTSSFSGAFSALSGIPTTLSGYGITDAQPLDSDLTTLAGLTATTDNFVVSVSSAWASRTPAQVRTTLGLVIGTNVQAWDADLDTWATITPATGVGTFLATPSSANLATAVTGETGSGALVFGTSPAITTPTGIVKGDVGLGNVDNTSDATKNSAAVSLTNKKLGSLTSNGFVKTSGGDGTLSTDTSTYLVAPTTTNDYSSFSITDGGTLTQPNRSTVSSTGRTTIAGSGRNTIYDLANLTPLKGVFNPTAFILRSGEYLLQYLRIILTGNGRATMTSDARLTIFNFSVGSRLTLAGRG